jgi:hypothetical protein
MKDAMTDHISLVLFDLDDVLCHYDRSARIAHIAAVVGRDAQAVRQAIWDSGLEGRADAGLVSDADYLDELGALLSYPLTLDDWLDARRAAMTPDPEAIASQEQSRLNIGSQCSPTTAVCSPITSIICVRRSPGYSARRCTRRRLSGPPSLPPICIGAEWRISG